MTITRNILNIIPGLQATSLVAHNLKAIPKFNMKGSRKMGMRKPVKNMVRLGVGNILGVGLIKPTSDIINTID